MTARVSWSVDGVEPSVRERAEASARRAGLSLGDWLNSAIGRPGSEGRDSASAETRGLAEIHQRLDSITRQVEQLARAPGAANSDPALGRQLNDAISRLDTRLSAITASSPGPAPDFGPSSFRPSPGLAPSLAPAMSPMDFSIAEIIARQGELDGGTPMPRRTAAQMPAPSFVAPTAAPPPPQPDYSGLERQLSRIAGQIDGLRRPDGIDQSIASFRSELSDIRIAITEALPRRAIESLEGEIRALGRRIDETRTNGAESGALAGIERALGDIYGTLRTLTPAEQLAGFDEAIGRLGGRIDQIVRASDDPATVRQLEEAIAALKVIVSNVATNDALKDLSGHVKALSAKVDQLSLARGNGDILAALEQRIATLTATLEQRERPVMGDTIYFDNAVRTISERLDHLQIGNDSTASLGHVEQRVQHLLERLEMSEARGTSGNLVRVEEGLSDILRHLEQQRTSSAAAVAAVPAMDGTLLDTIKRELSDIRFSQSETNRHTQDSLEAVHNTLGHVVDRLAQIEGDLRHGRTDPAARATARDIPVAGETPARNAASPEPVRAAASLAPPPRPELPNPATVQPPPARAQAIPVPPDMPAAEPAHAAAATPAAARPHPARDPIDPSLPPDHPLEPGTRPQSARAATPSERIAASEVVIGEISTPAPEPVSTTNFIQAARRAAQAAAAAAPAPAAPKVNRVTALNDAARNAAKAASGGESPISSKIRALLVGASVVVIVLGTVKMGMNLLGGRDSTSHSLPAETSIAPAATPPAGDTGPRSNLAPPAMPSITSPTPIERQPLIAPSFAVSPAPAAPAAAPAAEPLPVAPAATAPAAPEVTGAILTPQARIAAVVPAAPKPKIKLVPVSDKIPDGIGSATLRSAASKGDPGAAFEIGARYADGRGVPSDYVEAAKWYERAASGDIVPATFRLGTLYEKGLGTKKDIARARTYYLQAAEKGNAKAMHNLAVLDADGGGLGPDYKSAAQWFRKAAEHGVADSQFNLAILYARGIGVEQNLAESFKWFSLAATQGDADAARKRDDIAKRLDAQSLAAARLAAQTFVPEPQPDTATSSGAPAGGWDAMPPAKTAARPTLKPAAARTAAR
jgi:localization factor PodJL